MLLQLHSIACLNPQLATVYSYWYFPKFDFSWHNVSPHAWHGWQHQWTAGDWFTCRGQMTSLLPYLYKAKHISEVTGLGILSKSPCSSTVHTRYVTVQQRTKCDGDKLKTSLTSVMLTANAVLAKDDFWWWSYYALQVQSFLWKLLSLLRC